MQTYRDYHPIPVPFNIISIFVMGLNAIRKKIGRRITDEPDRAAESQESQVSWQLMQIIFAALVQKIFIRLPI